MEKLRPEEAEGNAQFMDCAVVQVSHQREQGMDFHLSHLVAPASPLEMSSSGYSRQGALSPDLY